MIYLPSGQREKGQDLIEYALLLALLVAVGVLIYSQGGLKDSLQTIFRNSGSLMETAAQGSSNGENNQEQHTIPEIVGQAIADGILTLSRGSTSFPERMPAIRQPVIWASLLPPAMPGP